MSISTQNPVTDERGDEHHPAFGVITVHDVSATPGAVLFQSDLRHGRYIALSIHEATRKRDLNHDWVHAGKTIIEVCLSQSQWAAMVASMGNGSGTPVTISHRERDGSVPGLPYQPRIAQSIDEVTDSTRKLLADLRAAFDELQALEDGKAGIKERREARRKLGVKLANAEANSSFAVRSMASAAEKAVSQAKADIEVAVAQAATKHGIETNLLDALGLGSEEVARLLQQRDGMLAIEGLDPLDHVDESEDG